MKVLSSYDPVETLYGLFPFRQHLNAKSSCKRSHFHVFSFPFLTCSHTNASLNKKFLCKFLPERKGCCELRT
jgi:hypothetical protein